MKKTKIMFLLSLVFAGLAAWLANTWVQIQTATNEEQAAKEKTTQIVVAAVDIKYGQTLDAVHLIWRKKMVVPATRTATLSTISPQTAIPMPTTIRIPTAIRIQTAMRIPTAMRI